MTKRELLKEADALQKQLAALENTKRFYVKNSSWFDSHPYDAKAIADTIKERGGRDVKLGHYNGWSNQPKVVLFTADERNLPSIKWGVQKIVGTEWIIILEKDW